MNALRRRENLTSENFRKKVKELIVFGKSIADISKQLGKSYAHTKNIVLQEFPNYLERGR